LFINFASDCYPELHTVTVGYQRSQKAQLHFYRTVCNLVGFISYAYECVRPAEANPTQGQKAWGK